MFKSQTPTMGPITMKDNTDTLMSLDLVTSGAGAGTQKNRCGSCRKKLMLSDMECRCKVRFCAVHRMPEDHACSFDHRGLARGVLAQQLVKVVGDKVEHI
jgi:hypothetical protein